MLAAPSPLIQNTLHATKGLYKLLHMATFATGYLRDGHLYLWLPPCTMALKSVGCPNCQYGSCMALAERAVRLVSFGRITAARHQELIQDLEQTCPLSRVYHDWLMENREHLGIGARSFKRTKRQRKDAVMQWLRNCASGCGSSCGSSCGS